MVDRVASFLPRLSRSFLHNTRFLFIIDNIAHTSRLVQIGAPRPSYISIKVVLAMKRREAICLSGQYLPDAARPQYKITYYFFITNWHCPWQAPIKPDCVVCIILLLFVYCPKGCLNRHGTSWRAQHQVLK